ncbi:hypothetical protein [Dethiobacter alkaliphilus]|uniref:hypothetical protein n=1 Tax=Dethiobacter alkaliphilus TaxID=427926 RepID=UPI002226CF1C|nr:hypothetical protein [Dethiobacter alkaliphilus]MCW3489694.1 hypothetical protein [Dethiobacter alkaliphilus]
MVKILFDLDEHLDSLANDLHEKYGLNMKQTVRNEFHCIDVLLTDTTYPYGKDWMPQMSFQIFFARKVIVLKAVRLPKDLQNKGIGTHCFNWLVDLCKKYDIEQIEGEAVGDSKGFWAGKGCVETPKKTVYQLHEKALK